MLWWTFNVRIDVPVDGIHQWPFRVDAIAKYIMKHQPDVIAMQEANIRMMSELMKLITGYRVLGEPRDQSGELSALLIKEETVQVIDEKTIWLTESPEVYSVIEGSYFPRIATIATLRIEGQTMVGVCTHLDYGLERVRMKQAQYLLDNLSSMDEPMIVLGDFNDPYPSKIITMFENEGFRMSYQPQQPFGTFHGFEGKKEGETIDYILVRGNLVVASSHVDYDTIEPIMLSDHFPVSALLHR